MAPLSRCWWQGSILILGGTRSILTASKSRKEKSVLLELEPGWSVQVGPSGLGFGSDPSWRRQEERGHFAASPAGEETPAKLLPEPGPPREL